MAFSIRNMRRSHSLPLRRFVSTESPGLVAAEAERFTVIQDFLSCEQVYTTALGNTVKYYAGRLKAHLPQLEMPAVVSVFESFCEFHNEILAGLKQLTADWSESTNVGNLLLQLSQFCRCYTTYTQNYPVALEELLACEANPHQPQVIQELYNRVAEDGKKVQPLESYLAMPIYQVSRYRTITEQLIAITPTNHFDYPLLLRALDNLHTILDNIAAEQEKLAASSARSIEEITSALSQLPEGVVVANPGLNFRCECDAKMLFHGEEKKVRVVLFSEALFIVEDKARKPRVRFPVGTLETTSPRRAPPQQDAKPLRSSLHCSQSLRKRSPRFPSTAGQATAKVEEALSGSATDHESKDHDAKPPTRKKSGQEQRTFTYLDSQNLADVLSISTPDVESIEIWCSNRPMPIVLQVRNRLAKSQLSVRLRSLIEDRAAVQNNLSTGAADRSPRSPRLQLPSASACSSAPTFEDRNQIWKALPIAASAAVSSKASSRLRSNRLRSSSEPTKAEILRDRCLLCEPVASPSYSEELGFNTLNYCTMVSAGFIPCNSVAMTQQHLRWEDIESPILVQKDLILRVPGFHFELGGVMTRPELYLPPFYMFAQYEVPFYSMHLAAVPHAVMFGCNGNDPFILSIERNPCAQLPGFRRAVIRTKWGERRCLAPLLACEPDSQAQLHSLERDLTDLLPHGIKWTHPNLYPSDRRQSTSLRQCLGAYDEQQRRQYLQVKIGVLATAPGDMVARSERHIYSRTDISPDFLEFLGFLGTTVPLRGYTGFAGGLDTVGSSTGTHSVCTTFAGAQELIDVMFHVSPLLPNTFDTDGRLSKKRLLCNDAVLLVFHEDEQPFDATVFEAKTHQVFLVVKKIGSCAAEGLPVYRLAVVCKQQAPCFPVLPKDPEFIANKNFHRFLLAKLVNAKAATHHSSPFLVAENVRNRSAALHAIISTYSTLTSTLC